MLGDDSSYALIYIVVYGTKRITPRPADLFRKLSMRDASITVLGRRTCKEHYFSKAFRSFRSLTDSLEAFLEVLRLAIVACCC